jgi:hypothetical protein
VHTRPLADSIDVSPATYGVGRSVPGGRGWTGGEDWLEGDARWRESECEIKRDEERWNWSGRTERRRTETRRGAGRAKLRGIVRVAVLT